MLAESVKQTIASGISPLETEFYAINTVSFDECMGYRSVLRINSVDLGVMYPEQYRVVTNRNQQCIKLSKYVLEGVLPLIPQLDRFVSVYIPSKMLLRGELYDWLEECKGFDFSHLAFEFSSDILLDDSHEVSRELGKLKEEFGSKLFISEVGDEFCPVLRLGELPLDSVILDKSLCSCDAVASPKVLSLISMLNDFNLSVFSEMPETAKAEEYIDALNSAGCVGYIAKRALSHSEVNSSGE